MNKKIRDACSVEIVECIYVRFRGKKNKGMRLPSDDGVLKEFLNYTIENEILPLEGAGVSGPGLYAYKHRKEDREKIINFFESEGIKVERFDT